MFGFDEDIGPPLTHRPCSILSSMDSFCSVTPVVGGGGSGGVVHVVDMWLDAVVACDLLFVVVVVV